jgi:hypothetical protein
MTTVLINKHATQTNASLQQLTANTNQLHQQQQDIINQMTMMTMNHGTTAPVTQQTFACAPPPINQPLALPHYQQGYNISQQQFGGQGTTGRRGGGYSRGGRYGCSGGRPRRERECGNTGIPMPYVGGNQLVPYIPGGTQQELVPNAPNKKKWCANQNVYYNCGFDVEDWHNSNSCPCKKEGHQNGFTRANCMQYEQVGYPFCKKRCIRTFTCHFDGVG